MRKLIAVMALATMTLVTGCTDTFVASVGAYGSRHEITVYQFQDVIYHGFSTGKVRQSDHAIQFEEETTHAYVDISLGQSATVVSKVVK